MACNDGTDGRTQEEKGHLYFPNKDSANEKPWTLLRQPIQLPFPFYKSILIPYHVHKFLFSVHLFL